MFSRDLPEGIVADAAARGSIVGDGSANIYFGQWPKIGAVKTLESAAQPNASDKLFSILLRVRRNEVFKVLGLDLSLVGFRETLALVDELKMVLNAAQHGTDEPGKPSSQRVPPTVPNPVLLCPHVM